MTNKTPSEKPALRARLVRILDELFPGMLPKTPVAMPEPEDWPVASQCQQAPPPAQSDQPAVEPPPLPDIVRKGTVLRLKQFDRQPDYYSWLGKPGGPCVIFVIRLEDEHGREVVTVEEARRTPTLLVGEGDSVLVTYNYSLRSPATDWVNVSLDLAYLKELTE